MGGGRINEPEPQDELWKDDEFATADEGQALALFAGEALLAPIWVSPLYGLRAVPAPAQGGKK